MKTEAKHTPGPWHWRRAKMGTHPAEVRWTQVDGNGGGPQQKPLAVRGRIGATIARLTGPSAEADARLIAAAPDLLEACKALMNTCELNVDDMEQETFSALRKAQDAITKASGKAQ